MSSDLTSRMTTQSISFPGKVLPAEDGAWRPWHLPGLPNLEGRQQWDNQHIPAAALTLSWCPLIAHSPQALPSCHSQDEAISVNLHFAIHSCYNFRFPTCLLQKGYFGQRQYFCRSSARPSKALSSKLGKSLMVRGLDSYAFGDLLYL